MQITPRARQERLIIERIADETLVYDLERHQAHCLNRTAALVWEQCDGRNGVPEIAAALRRELGDAADEQLVWQSLERLSRARLLDDPVHRPDEVPLPSRRQLAQQLGTAAALAAVTSIVAPGAQAAASTCIASAVCILLSNKSCPNVPCCENPTRRCTKQTSGTRCNCVAA
jgi:hypothetical protein